MAGPPCQTRWRSDAVFVGKVVSINPLDPQAADGTRSFSTLRRIHIQVSEAFAGVPAGETDVYSGTGAADCGFAFEVGREYVVYANRLSDGRLATGICSGTRRLEGATEDLRYLRSLSTAAATEGRIFGTITREPIGQRDTYSNRPPYAGARVTIEGRATRRVATTDANGRYEVTVPAGEYRVNVGIGEEMYVWSERAVTLNDPRGCAVANFFARYNGRILTGATDSRGNPVPHLALELIPPGQLNGTAIASVFTGDDGTAVFDRIPPGRYTLGFNTQRESNRVLSFQPVYFPGTTDRREWREFVVGPGTVTTLNNLVVPDSIRIVTLSGVVLDTTGRRVAGASVYLKADAAGARTIGGAVKTDADGRFRIAGVAGGKYRVLAEMRSGDRNLAAEVTDIVASAETATITLRFEQR